MNVRSFITSLLILLALSSRASALTMTDNYTVNSNQTITAESWIISDVAFPSGTFENDLLIGTTGQQPLSLNGTYKGNLWAGNPYSEVLLSGHAERNVRLAGHNVRIDGTIDGNLSVIAMQSITFTPNAKINGSINLLCYGSSVITDGTVGGSANITTPKNASLNGTIGGHATIRANEILFGKNGQIGGNLNYATARELFPAEGVVTGKLTRIDPPSPYSKEHIQRHLLFFLAALLAGIPFLSLFPTTIALSTMTIRRAPFKCLAIGFLATLLLPILAGLSINSILGLPMGLLLLGSWAIVAYVSRFVVGMVIGTIIFRSGNTSFRRLLLSMTTGLTIIYTLTFFTDLSALLVVTSMGTGALLLTISQKRRMVVQLSTNLKQTEKQNPEE